MLTRRERFFAGTRAAHAIADLKGDITNPLVDRLMALTRAQIDAHAAALHLPSIPSGLLDQMLAHAKHRLAQLSPSEFARIGSGNALMAQIASESFAAVVGTRDPATLKSMFTSFPLTGKGGDKLHGPYGRSLPPMQRQLADYAATRDGAKASAGCSSELGTREIMANRELARSLGMGWAAATDLMRLPRHELMALAASKITDKTYFSLRELKYSDKGIVAMAEWANKEDVDINKLHDDLKKQGEIVANGDPKKAQDYHQAIQQFFVNKAAGDPDTEKKLQKALPTPTTEQGKKALEKTQRLLKTEHEQLAKDLKQTDEEKLRTGEEKLKKADAFDALYDAPSPPAAKPAEVRKADAPPTADATKTANVAPPAAKPDAKSATPERPATQTATAPLPKAPAPTA